MIFKIIVALLLLSGGSWQIYSTRHYLKHLQAHGDENTSPFSPAALYFGYFYGVVFILLAISIVIN